MERRTFLFLFGQFAVERLKMHLCKGEKTLCCVGKVVVLFGDDRDHPREFRANGDRDKAFGLKLLAHGGGDHTDTAPVGDHI